MAISFYVGKNECYKNVLKTFQMSEQYWGFLDKMYEANFSPAETLQHMFWLRNKKIIFLLCTLN